MLKNYLAVTLRVFRKNPVYSGINVIGLALGLACCLLILLFVQYERSYDGFHTKGDRLFRLNKVVTPQEGGTERHAITSGPMAPALIADYAEVETATRVLPWFSDVLLVNEQTVVKTPDLLLADANFFDVFDFELLRGRSDTVLDAPMSIVLTSSMSERLFGRSDPVGRTIIGLNDLEYLVTGVAADPPANSHLKFNAIVSWSSTLPGDGTLNFEWLNNWLPQAIFTYVLLVPGADPGALEARFAAFMQRHFPQRAEQYHLYLQPFNDIYLGSSNILHNNRIRQGTWMYVSVFSIVALLILVIACINFMNLVTARATRRAREVGVRKVAGASRWQLAQQFVGEALLTVALALIVALVIVEIVRPSLATFTGTPMSLGILNGYWLFAALVLLPAAVALIAGAYPALVLSSFQPAAVLKGGSGDTAGSLGLRRILVTLQFAVTIVLIAGTLVVYRQMAFVQSRDLGFDGDQIVILPTGRTAIPGQFEAFKSEILDHPNVIEATGSSSVPGFGMSSFGLLPEGKPDSETWTSWMMRVDDFDLISTYRMKMAQGRYFSPDRPADSTDAVVVNEALARMLGWDDPVGKRLDVRGETEGARVIGVVQDYHFESLHQAIDPLVILVAPRGSNLSVRITGEDVTGTLAHMRHTWEQFDPQYAFEYSFLDEAFAAQYQNDQRLMRILGVFASLAIIIACLGLFGLAAYTAERRTKEIGVRKVLGASVASIVVLLSREFIRLVGVALVIAAPIVFLVMRRWLSDFAYRIELDVVPVVVAGAVAVIIAAATVGHQAIRAALADPVRSIRYE